MKTRSLLLAAGFALLLTCLPAMAHHSFSAEYDQSKPLTVKGKVTKMDWVNPHSWVYVDVTGEDGKVTNYACETAPPNTLYRMGWRKDSVKAGDDVVIEGFLAKDGSTTVNARSVKMADGRTLFAGSPDSAPQTGSKPDEKK
jgi:hypothetical protein